MALVIFSILSVLAVCIHASPFDTSFLSTVKFNSKIAGGNEASRDEFLYKCALYIQKSTDSDINFCSGSIISARFALSAAHCFTHIDSGILIAGVHNLQEEEAPHDWDFGATDVILHERYDAAVNLNDIALINATAYPFALATVNSIRQIKIASQSLSADNLVGMIGRIAGWGQTTDSNIDISSSLRYIDAEILDLGACRAIYGNKVTPTNICLSGDDGRSTCQGDSGGGLQVFYGNETILVGVVSFGAEVGCEKNYPTVFTFIPPYREWINSIVNDF